ncbi:RrF2 family transcriptional regulator [Polaribacter sp. Hel1_85]|uniref:RrF2 family transcriptional regulator n=1 Tax=Polaribacter sp. Hel1_85 TaxID=1250005 RepID=UPI00052D6C76|nr:Rrf2 family transcriptional regulator [Polaribacter sp. Hel1_85]KGL63539.1 transcriptional regulator, Rrf2 family [Polaribacter sp. Hel1_85]
MLSKASKYAITAVLHLANKTSKEKKLGSKKLANQLNIPAPFLAKTLQELTRKGIISSIKGPHGGFYLSKENEKKTLFNIIDCLDDIEKFNQCYLGQPDCSDEKPCVVHHLYMPFKKELIKKLKDKTILEMAKVYTNKDISSEFYN